MQNNNIFSTPDITGNIGSCTTQVNSVSTDRTFWTVSKKDIATNSCTGDVSTYDYWNFSGTGEFFLLAIPVIIFLAFVAYLDR
jgi:hypothetical protein